MKFNSFLFVVAVGCLQLALAQTTCPYAYSLDGYQYDLTDIAYQTQQYVAIVYGYKFTYNMSLCFDSRSPTSCGSCPIAGVCQSWGPYLDTCFGSSSTRRVNGLPRGAGVQFIFDEGDFCPSCSPSDYRTSVITLLCDQSLTRGEISWARVVIAGPGMPSTSYFNGSMYCDVQHKQPTEPSSEGSSCQNIYAPDGSYYDLSQVMGRDFSTVFYSNSLQLYTNVTFAVCGGIKGYCGPGACEEYGSAAVRQYYEKALVEKCYGQYDSKTWVQGLNAGEGVVITYNDGDACKDCSPRGPRRTVLRLTCGSYYYPSELYIEQVSNDPHNSILYINATIGCTSGSSNELSSSVEISAPSSDHVEISYYGYGACSGQVYLATVIPSQYCYSLCSAKGNRYTRSTCDEKLILPRGHWAEVSLYDSQNCTASPSQVRYTPDDNCVVGYSEPCRNGISYRCVQGG